MQVSLLNALLLSPIVQSDRPWQLRKGIDGGAEEDAPYLRDEGNQEGARDGRRGH